MVEFQIVICKRSVSILNCIWFMDIAWSTWQILSISAIVMLPASLILSVALNNAYAIVGEKPTVENW